MMQGWDATLSRESGAAALYEVWLKELRKVVAEKEGVESLQDDWELENVLEYLSESIAAGFRSRCGRGQKPGVAADSRIRMEAD